MIKVKPIQGQRTGIGQALDQFLKETKLPINQWYAKKQAELKGKKF